MAQRVGKGVTYTRGIYLDEETRLMAMALARVKKSNISQVFREGVAKMFKEEFGSTNVEKVLEELGLQ